MAKKLTRVVLRLSDIKQLDKFIDKMESNKTWFSLKGKKKIERIASEIETYFTKPLLTKLQTYPPVRDRTRKAKWKSDKQRRYVMMMWSMGLIHLPYVRTGKLSRGWQVSVELKWTRQNKLGILRVTVTNTENYAQYVVGEYGLGETRKSLTTYRKPQQPMHKSTGWELAYPPIQSAFAGIRKHVMSELSGWSALEE